MDDNDLPPIASVRAESPIPGGTRTSHLVFLTIAALVVAACILQALWLLVLLMINPTMVPGEVLGVLGSWLAVTGLACGVGVAGVYRGFRVGSGCRRRLLAFGLIYSLVGRAGGVSLGWPVQFRLEIILGATGLGVNLVGVALIAWWLVLKIGEAARADAADADARAGRAIGSHPGPTTEADSRQTKPTSP